MTQELKPGEFYVNEDGGLVRCSRWTGDLDEVPATELAGLGWGKVEDLAAQLIDLGYTRVYPESIQFPSGRTYSTEGSAIKEVAPAEVKRAPLTWNTKTPFDPFKGWEVYSDAVSSGFAGSAPAAELHALQRMTEGTNPTHGSALLLKD